MADDYGTDVSTFVMNADNALVPGLDPEFATISGTRALGEAITRRLITPRGGLHYDLDYGYDVRAHFNDDFSKNELQALQSNIELECEKDERVLKCDAKVTIEPHTMRMTVELNITLVEDRPFLLTLTIDNVNAAVLAIEAA